MYVVAGHFSYLEFAVADRSCPFVWQIANLARLAVSKARGRDLEPDDEGIRMDLSDTGEIKERSELLDFNDVSKPFWTLLRLRRLPSFFHAC